MKLSNIQQAVEAAKQFIEQAEIATNNENRNEWHSEKYSVPGKHSAALKRRSMDLTRSLSKMRQDLGN